MTTICISLIGCQTTHPKNKPAESTQETLDAVGSMTGALTGQTMSDEQTRKVVADLRKDKEAQSAVQSISNAMNVQQAEIKYCPVDGKRFSVDLEDCPEHHVKLERLVE